LPSRPVIGAGSWPARSESAPAAAAAPLPAAPQAAFGPGARQRNEIDIDVLVEKVQRKLLRNLAAERERKGLR
jgi:hypothetical protein